MLLPRTCLGLAPAVVVAALGACNGELPAGGAGHEVKELQVGGALDVLFVIENAGSIWERQEPLALAFPQLLAALRGPDGELPSLHVGVVSTSPGKRGALPLLPPGRTSPTNAPGPASGGGTTKGSLPRSSSASRPSALVAVTSNSRWNH